MEQQINYYNTADEIDEELTIDFKKIVFAIWNRRELIIKVFSCVLVFFIFLTFISPKKYKVDADLYINKSINSNMAEFNPYVIEELGAGGGMAALMAGGGGSLVNELELIKSPLVIDKVIRENNLVFKKKWGFIPNKREGEYISTAAFLKKNISIENKKGTNVVTIEYKSKKPELAYNIVNSIINNYIILHKQLHSEKSKSDKKVIEAEYKKAKAELDKKASTLSGLPEQAAASTGHLSAMSAFSTSASQALSAIRGQVVEGTKAKIEITEEASKVAQLSSKLEWAKMVEEMSETSKVLVLKEPKNLRKFEYASPKLFTNILLGIIFGIIASLIALIYIEIADKKLAYSMLGDNIIYNLDNDFSDLKLVLLAKQDKKVLFAMFDNISQQAYSQLQEFKNITMVKADISNEFVNIVNSSDEVMIVAKIGATNSKLYKQVKSMIKEINKTISKEILV